MITRRICCSECKEIREISSNKARKKGHLKHCYCFNCKKQTAHIDVTKVYNICPHCNGLGVIK